MMASLSQPFKNFMAPAVIPKPLGLKLKRLFRDLTKEIQFILLSATLPWLLVLYHATWRVKAEIHPDTQALLDAGKPVIFAFWHGRMYATVPPILPRDTTDMLVSQSSDGNVVTNVLRGVGYKHFVRGSHKRGGMSAMRTMIRSLLVEKHCVCFMLDGPKGPAHEVKPGIIRLAAQTGVPIIPVVSSLSYFMMRFTWMWDKLQYPGILSSVVVRLEAPFYASPKDQDKGEEDRIRLENLMKERSEAIDLEVYGKSLLY
jgi:lysophospholipid acyltransferase (LPLAT)-like uncharacterized protein